MKTIVVLTQKDLDDIPAHTKVYTEIQIKSTKIINVKKSYNNSTVNAYNNSIVNAYNNSTVTAYNNSTVNARGSSTVTARGNSTVNAYNNSTVNAYNNSIVNAWDNSTVTAWNNSTVNAYNNSTVTAYNNSTMELFLFSYIIVMSSSVVIKKLLDFSTAVMKGCNIKEIEEIGKNSTIKKVPLNANVSFEEWLDRGYVVADGINKKLKSKKKIGDVEVYECIDFPKKTTSYVVRRNGVFSHGKTIEKAIKDLRFKISDRNLDEFEYWKNNLEQEISLDKAIQGYRVITGACEFGTKEFVEAQGILPDNISINRILKLTKNSYGNDKLKEFLGC